MLAEPMSGADRATQQFSSFSQAALQSAASVVLAPPRPARMAGVVAVVALRRDDKAIETAAAIAAAAHEELIIIHVSENEAAAKHAEPILNAGLAIRDLTVDARALMDPRYLIDALDGLDARILVTTRGIISDDTARSISSLRRLPVLMIEPTDRIQPSPRKRLET